MPACSYVPEVDESWGAENNHLLFFDIFFRQKNTFSLPPVYAYIYTSVFLAGNEVVSKQCECADVFCSRFNDLKVVEFFKRLRSGCQKRKTRCARKKCLCLCYHQNVELTSIYLKMHHLTPLNIENSQFIKMPVLFQSSLSQQTNMMSPPSLKSLFSLYVNGRVQVSISFLCTTQTG